MHPSYFSELISQYLHCRRVVMAISIYSCAWSWCLKTNIISEHNRNFPFVVDLPVSGMNLSWGRYRVKPSPLCCSQEDLHRGLPLISIASLWLRLIPWPLLIFFFQKKAGLHIYVYFTPEFYQARCILILIRQKKTVISMITRVLTSRARICYVDRDGLTPASYRWGALTVWERHAGWSGTFLLITDLIRGPWAPKWPGNLSSPV